MTELSAAVFAAQQGCTLDPFTYSMEFLPATLSAVTEAQFVVQSDAAFCILKSTILVTSTASPPLSTTLFQPFGTGVDQAFLPFLISLTDQGAGRTLMDRRIPVDSLFGNAMRPYCWPTPKVLDANSTFTGSLQNLNTASFNVRLAFHGYKVFGNVPLFVSKLRTN